MSTTLFVACHSHARAFEVATDVNHVAAGRVLAHPIRIDDALSLAGAADVLMIEPAAMAAPGLSAIADRTKLVLMCDSYASPDLILYMTLGASGCVLASSSSSLLAEAAATVHAGYAWFTGCTAPARERSARAGTHSGATAAPLPDLTPREREIVSLVGDGLTNKQIARRLDISDKTVQTQLHHVYVKLRQSGRYKAFNSVAAKSWTGELPCSGASATVAAAPRTATPRRDLESCARCDRSRPAPCRVRR